jgi:hypothetical protein
MESEAIASQLNARLIRINPRESDGPEDTIGIPLGALEALERIDSSLMNLLQRSFCRA